MRNSNNCSRWKSCKDCNFDKFDKCKVDNVEVLGGGKHWVGFFVVVGLQCGATRSLTGGGRGVVFFGFTGWVLLDGQGRCADGSQGQYARGQVSRCVLRVRFFVGANRGVACLGQQRRVVYK